MLWVTLVAAFTLHSIIQSFPQQVQPSSHSGQRSLHEGVMLGSQSLEGIPVHPLGLPAVAVEDAWLPPQVVADAVGASCRSVVPDFPPAGVGQLVAMPTGEDAAAECRSCRARLACSLAVLIWRDSAACACGERGRPCFENWVRESPEDQSPSSRPRNRRTACTSRPGCSALCQRRESGAACPARSSRAVPAPWSGSRRGIGGAHQSLCGPPIRLIRSASPRGNQPRSASVTMAAFTREAMPVELQVFSEVSGVAWCPPAPGGADRARYGQAGESGRGKRRIRSGGSGVVC